MIRELLPRLTIKLNQSDGLIHPAELFPDKKKILFGLRSGSVQVNISLGRLRAIRIPVSLVASPI